MRRALGLLLVGLLFVGVAAACSSDDGDGGSDGDSTTTSTESSTTDTTAASDAEGDTDETTDTSTPTESETDGDLSEATEDSDEVAAYCAAAEALGEEIQAAIDDPSSADVEAINAQAAELSESAATLQDDHPDELERINDCAQALTPGGN